MCLTASFSRRGTRSVCKLLLDCPSLRQPAERFTHGWSLTRFNIIPPALMKRREDPVGTSKYHDLLTILLKLTPGEPPKSHTIRQRVEIGSRAAAPQAHSRTSVIENLRNDSASGTSHRWRDTSIDSLSSLAQNEPLLGVGEQEHHFRVKREVGKGTIESMFYLALHYRDGSDFVVAHIIEPDHRSQGGL